MLLLSCERSVRGLARCAAIGQERNFMKTRAVLWAAVFFIICHLTAQIQNVQVTGTTSTQAVLSYTASSAAACQVEVSTDSSFGPLVNDVQPALFPGSNLDSRDGSVANGLYRQFVVGRRTAETATDGKRYSRALQANTQHYFRITCGTDVATGSFQTSNVPLGQAFNDPLPVDPAHPGQYAWPTLSQTDRTQTIVDPQTGVLIRRLSLAGDQYCHQGNTSCWPSPIVSKFSSAYDPTGTWPTPASVISDDQNATSVSGSQQALFLDPALSIYRGGSHSTTGSSLNYMQVILNSWCSDNGDACASTATQDRTIQVALTVDRVNPATDWEDQVVTGCSANCTGSGNRYTIGSTTPILASWISTATPSFDLTDVSPRSGTVNTSGTSVFWTSGNYFDILWGNGSQIVIAGTAYTIASVNNERSITLTASAGTNTGASYSANNFGVLVRKKTASADTLYLQYAGITYDTGGFPGWDASGDEEANTNCSNAMVAGPNGEMGFHCNVGGELYWIGDTTGTFTRIGPTGFAAHGGTDGYARFTAYPGVFWDKSDGNTLYATTQDNGGHSIILKATYNGGNADVGNLDFFATLPECGSAPCWTITNLTPASQGKTLSQLLAAFSPDYAAFNPGLLQITDQAANNFTIQIRQQNGPTNNGNGFMAVYSPAAQNIIAATPSWKYWPNRWSALHGAINIDDSDYMLLPLVGHYGPWSGSDTNGDGPYSAKVTSGAIGSDGQACPAWDASSGISQSSWPTGNNCITITVDGEPCDPTPGPNEPADGGTHCGNPNAYYLQNAAPRDFFCIVNDPTTRQSTNTSGCGEYYQKTGNDPNGVEYFRLLVKQGGTWIAQRGWYGTTTIPFLAKNANAYVVMAPTSCDINALNAAFCSGAADYWKFTADPLGQNGTSYIDMVDLGGGHGFHRPGLEAATVSGLCPAIDGLSNGCYNVRRGWYPDLFIAPNYTISNNPSFNGKTGEGQPNNVDGHPSFTQYPMAAGLELSWFTDARPFLGDNFLTGSSSNPAQLVSGTLYKLSSSQMSRFRPRQMPTLAACGVNPLLDISGPSSSITGNPPDNYKYCVANAAGECTPSSSPGDVYVNCPQISTPYCPYMGVGNLDADIRGICIGDNGGQVQGLTQVGFATADPLGSYSRIVTHAFSRYYWTDQFWNVKTTPDGKWLLFRTPWADGLRSDTFIAQLPPYPPADTVNRTDFQMIPIGVSPPANLAVDNAVVEFGYNSNYFCTTRQDACVRGNQGGSVYAFASENPAGMSCTNGCTIYIPAISQRVLYYSVIYRDAQNNVLSQSGAGAIAVP